VLNLVFYFFFYWDGATFGYTPVHTRYYAECILVGVIPLVARSLCLVWGWLQTRRRAASCAATLVAVLLAANTAYSFTRFPEQFRSTGAFYWRLEQLINKGGVHNAVIFVSGLHAPVGEYPFKRLEQADVVYFRLGNSKSWGLSNTDSHAVFQRYFRGRRAYLFVEGKLLALQE
jgi:hypothetical protein